MRPLSASEAIGPALERTRDVLGRPFRFGTFLKIAAVAFFAEIGGGFNLSFPSRSGGMHGVPPAALAFIVAFAVIFAVVSLTIGLILLYVSSRFQLVLLELVASRQTYIAPLWRKYGRTTWRWIGLKVAFFLSMLLVVAVIASPGIVFFVRRMHGTGGPFSGLSFPLIFLLIATGFLILVVLFAAYALLRDFALPFLAFEDVSIAESLRRLRAMLAAEPGDIALFLLLRLLLGVIFAIGGEMVVALGLLLSIIPFALVGGGLWLALHKAGAAGIAVLVGLAIVGGLALFCWMVVVLIGALGSVYTFIQAYALYFLGGRYPLLGNLLDRSTPPPSYPPAASFPAYPAPYYPPPQMSPPGAPPSPSNP